MLVISFIDSMAHGENFIVTVVISFGERGMDRYSAVIDRPFVFCVQIILYEMRHAVKKFLSVSISANYILNAKVCYQKVCNVIFNKTRYASYQKNGPLIYLYLAGNIETIKPERIYTKKKINKTTSRGRNECSLSPRAQYHRN